MLVRGLLLFLTSELGGLYESIPSAFHHHPNVVCHDIAAMGRHSHFENRWSRDRFLRGWHCTGREVKDYDVLSVQQIQFSNEQKTTVLPTTSKLNKADTAFTFPAGSKMTIRMIDSISSENQTAGSLFLASIEQPIMSGGVEVIPKGADVWGRVTSSDPAGSGADRDRCEWDSLFHRYCRIPCGRDAGYSVGNGVGVYAEGAARDWTIPAI
jgi:hypothetical protein